MPISGSGWEMHIVRVSVQTIPGHTRTVGRYTIYHDGVAQTGQYMSGTTAEAKGPGDNSTADNGRRIEAKKYPLQTWSSDKYKTYGYSASLHHKSGNYPALGLRKTGARYAILLHPGKNAFLSSVGCINPCTSLPNAGVKIDYVPSRARTIATIENLKAYLGTAFPKTNNANIPRAHIVIDGEP